MTSVQRQRLENLRVSPASVLICYVILSIAAEVGCEPRAFESRGCSLVDYLRCLPLLKKTPKRQLNCEPFSSWKGLQTLLIPTSMSYQLGYINLQLPDFII